MEWNLDMDASTIKIMINLLDTLDYGKMISKKVKDLWNTLMDQNIMEIGQMGREMVLENIFLKIKQSFMAFGKMIYQSKILKWNIYKDKFIKDN